MIKTVPIGSYPTPFLRYLLFYIGDPNHKPRKPKKGVGYDPLGIVILLGSQGRVGIVVRSITTRLSGL